MSGDHIETEPQAIARAVEECKGASKLITVLQTPERRAHRTTIELIKEMLEEAESGNVVEIVMVGFRANGNYLQLASPTMSHTTRIAALEDIKFEIQMAAYEEERGMHARGPHG